jgi:hypothetical protein
LIDTRAGILHPNAHVASVWRAQCHPQRSFTTHRRIHGLDCIRDHVEEDLLQLYLASSHHDILLCGDFQHQLDMFFYDLSFDQFENFTD